MRIGEGWNLAPGGIRAGGTKPGGEQAAVLLAMSKGPIGLGLDGK